MKKKLIKFFVSLLTMIVVTIVGYLKSEFDRDPNEEILAKPRNAISII